MSLKLVKSLKLQNDKLWSLDFAHGLLATGSTDRKIKIISVKDKDHVKLVDVLDDTVHKKAIRSVAWRPHSNLLAAGSFDSTVSIWSKESFDDLEIEDDDEETNDSTAATDERTLEMDLLAIIEGHENEVKGIAWSHDGYLLATCSRDKSVWIWETDETGEEYECVSVLQEHSQDVKHVVWHPTLPLLASSSYDDTIRLWKDYDDDWECAAVLNGHEGTVWCSDFEKMLDLTEETCNDRLRLCSASDDSTVRVWKYIADDEDGQQEWECEAILPAVHARQIYSVSWGPNGLIASTGSDGTLAIYKETENHDWEVIAKRELCHGVYEVNIVKWIDVNGKMLLATGGDDGCANLWSWDE
ncbi:iron-sulfur cluster assembly protein CIA1 NDAI_0H00820 [Naumovozyma dairenensis CBS 421]|uniref:Probable cytosolic iron-sulfur protein assembly protein 1 n=1 Tax=Naumovozyma dairenensis (strain ATCC 10597 / BCRC 20456 / CBS 421 / NBRC 0211 / NRRL Y-12639) TaxID=1071378 RepID=G0WEP5_NAUDC|nr:hypothetical protein NDAI_0H00820 [Naumovozyma dairenensis CBS 421]CCD26256.1 hypothetical protein NDAI_0H00820 [Naumovozyma dairenensis CBS 421]